jgi:hypothetical protein
LENDACLTNTYGAWPSARLRDRMTGWWSGDARSRWHGTSARPRACRLLRSPSGSAGPRRRSRRTSMTQPARRHGRSRPATSACAGAAVPKRRRATVRATPTPIARRATPARSRADGPPSGCSTRCATGAAVTAGSRRPTTGRVRTRRVGAIRHLSDWAREIGPRRA